MFHIGFHTDLGYPKKDRRLLRTVRRVVCDPLRWSTSAPLDEYVETAMSDYTPLGLQKLAHHAANDLTTVRCPRDSVVMRLLRCRAERSEAGGVTQREFHRAPQGGEWEVREVDFECPACRRRAMGVRLAPAEVLPGENQASDGGRTILR